MSHLKFAGRHYAYETASPTQRHLNTPGLRQLNGVFSCVISAYHPNGPWMLCNYQYRVPRWWRGADRWARTLNLRDQDTPGHAAIVFSSHRCCTDTRTSLTLLVLLQVGCQASVHHLRQLIEQPLASWLRKWGAVVALKPTVQPCLPWSLVYEQSDEARSIWKSGFDIVVSSAIVIGALMSSQQELQPKTGRLERTSVGLESLEKTVAILSVCLRPNHV